MELSRAPKVIVGEIAYNLRCSLDYLIYELAVHNTGRKSKRMRTQFVIVDKPEAFTGQARKYLSKLTTEQIRMVETLQPYRGGWWTALIRDLNTPDKHRHLVDVLTHDANTRVFFGPVETVQEAASKYPGVKVLAEVDERGRTICSVSEVVGVYIDGRPAYSVVNHLHMSVCRTLTDFAPQFA